MNENNLVYTNSILVKLCFRFFLLIVLGISTFSLYSQNNSAEKTQLTVKLIISTDSIIDHLVFTKFGGFLQEDVHPFQDTMELPIPNLADDMYQLLCMGKHQNLVEHLWLKGEKIIIKANIKEGTLAIDTVINAPFYYYTKNIMETYEALIERAAKRGEINDFLLKAIQQNIDHSFSTILASKYIEQNINQLENLQILASIIDNQKPEIKKHLFSVHENLQQLTGVSRINFSDFKFIDIALEEINIRRQKNTIYLLDFWFTNCAPCIEEHKKIQKQLINFKQAGIEVIGISIDYDQTKWADFLNAKQYKWVNYKERNEDGNTLSKYLGIVSFPTYLIVNEHGEILNRTQSVEESIAFLKAAKILT